MASLGNLMGSLGDVPEDVIVEILLRLPVESLVRFKCVCKSWYDLINSPKFVAKQLGISVQQRNVPNSSSATVLVHRYFFLKDSGSKESILSFLTYPHADDESVVVIDVPILEDNNFMGICGHSHGMVCLSDFRSDIALCNPATREFRILPPSILLLPEPQKEEHDNVYEYYYYESPTTSNAVGFGYDPKSKDFKVVRVVDFVEGRLGFFHPRKAEVYDLSTDRWRVIDTPVCADVCWQPSFEMYYKGIYYWSAVVEAEGGDGELETIQLFDMSEEVFSLIPVPEYFLTERRNFLTMGVLNGSIILFLYPWIGDEKTITIWVMEKKESGGGVSWSKAWTIGPLSGIEKPLLFMKSDELLMEAEGEQMVSYNINTREFKNLPLKGERNCFQATFLTKSLLSVKGGRGNKLDLGFASEII